MPKKYIIDRKSPYCERKEIERGHKVKIKHD